MPDCTREKALSIAIKYLGEQYLGKLHVSDKLPDCLIYNKEQYHNSWSITVPEVASSCNLDGGSRYIFISKKTGKIVFDEIVGG